MNGAVGAVTYQQLNRVLKHYSRYLGVGKRLARIEGAPCCVFAGKRLIVEGATRARGCAYAALKSGAFYAYHAHNFELQAGNNFDIGIVG